VGTIVEEGNLLPFDDGRKAMVPIFAGHARRRADGMRNEAANAKQEWVHEQVARLLQYWYKCNNSLSITPEYVTQIERDLARYYEPSHMRAFIENADEVVVTYLLDAERPSDMFRSSKAWMRA
jgi:hypothetical protein